MGITNNIPPSRLIQPGVIDNTAARPASPFEGQCIFQKDTDQLLVWNGTAWVIPNQTTQNPEGLELVKTQTIGTGVLSQTVTDAFSAIYDNYLILISGGSATGDSALNMTVGSKVTNYYGTLLYANYASTPLAYASKSFTSWIYTGFASPNGIMAEIFIGNPFLSKDTYMRANHIASNDAGFFNGKTNDTTSYTSFTLTSAYAMTGGTISVYGYRK